MTIAPTTTLIRMTSETIAVTPMWNRNLRLTVETEIPEAEGMKALFQEAAVPKMKTQEATIAEALTVEVLMSEETPAPRR